MMAYCADLREVTEECRMLGQTAEQDDHAKSEVWCVQAFADDMLPACCEQKAFISGKGAFQVISRGTLHLLFRPEKALRQKKWGC